jgi:hypothetical protein
MKLRTFSLVALVLVLSLSAVSARATTVDLGSAASFAVLGASSVTNTGATTINGGNVGVYPGTSITGDTTITITAGNTIGEATATNQSDLATAIGNLSGLPSTTLSSTTLGAVTFTPGVYSSSALTLNGTVTLDAAGQNNVDFIFLLGSSLTDNSNVVLTDPGTNDGVYWVEESGSATLDGSSFVGNVLANASITMGAGVDITCGSALASTGAVTMIGDTITTGCTGNGNTIGGSGSGGTGGTGTPTPELGTFALLSSGLLAMTFLAFRKPRVASLV